jgi:pyrroloquinoline quinone biosynthesis protein B
MLVPRVSSALVTADSLADGPFTVVLGIAQDGGYPQAGCRLSCCERVRADPALRRHAASLAVVDPRSGQRWLVDATPDFREQLRRLDSIAPRDDKPPGLAGIVLTHGHVGHYTGLAHLGRESMDAEHVPVYAMPRMRQVLATNLPWSDLVRHGHVELHDMSDGDVTARGEGWTLTPVRVPHRDEHTETVGVHLQGPSRSVLYVPDTDGWDGWRTPIESWLGRVDVAYLDGTFYDMGELPGRDMADVPHPTISASMQRFAALAPEIRQRVRFLHLNHTNPCMDPDTDAAAYVRGAGFGLAAEGEQVAI